MSMPKTRRKRTSIERPDTMFLQEIEEKNKKEFLQEIVEPAIQYEEEVEPAIQYEEEVEPEVVPKVNWDELNERQREEIIQKERLKDARPEKRPV